MQAASDIFLGGRPAPGPKTTFLPAPFKRCQDEARGRGYAEANLKNMPACACVAGTYRSGDPAVLTGYIKFRFRRRPGRIQCGLCRSKRARSCLSGGCFARGLRRKPKNEVFG
jgi:hypothetical protein